MSEGISDRYEELKQLFSQVGLRVTPQSQKAASRFVKSHPSSLSKLKTFEPRSGKLIPVVETSIAEKTTPHSADKIKSYASPPPGFFRSWARWAVVVVLETVRRGLGA